MIQSLGVINILKITRGMRYGKLRMRSDMYDLRLFFSFFFTKLPDLSRRPNDKGARGGGAGEIPRLRN